MDAARWWWEEDAATTTEYALLAALIGIAMLVAVGIASGGLQDLYQGVADRVVGTTGS